MSKQSYISPAQFVIFIIVLVVPRVLRFFHPAVNLEDSPYLDAVSCMARGLKPHIDFVYTHIPFPEVVLTILCKLFGVSYRVTETVSAVTVTITALLIFVIARRIQSKRAGVVSALLYAWHPLIFNYHLFEKEIYEALLACLLGVFFIREEKRERISESEEGKTFSTKSIKVLYPALLCFLGYITKLDFSFLVGALLFYIAMVEKKPIKAFLILFIFVSLAALHTLISFHFFGWEFLKQIYLFHFLKGSESSQGIKLLKWLAGSGWLAVPGVFGFVFLKSASLRHRLYLILWLAAPLFFFSLVTDTLWFHNVINVLPPLSVLAGLYIDGTIGLLRGKDALCGGGREAKGFFYLVLFSLLLWAASIVLSVLWFAKIDFGFQGASRRETREVSKIVKNVTSFDAVIIAPAIISAQANRTELIHNREVAPVYWWVMRRVEDVGFTAARKEVSAIHFRALSEKAAHLWLDETNEKIAAGAVSLVVGELIPGYYSFNPKAEDMERYGYRRIYQGDSYVVWVKK